MKHYYIGKFDIIDNYRAGKIAVNLTGSPEGALLHLRCYSPYCCLPGLLQKPPNKPPSWCSLLGVQNLDIYNGGYGLLSISDGTSVVRKQELEEANSETSKKRKCL
ncbi:hypothetical protein A6R68_22843 [Neotoma lepida]|uniref:Uncharacterized protein n=1 Tax=Neotoma lepida TaxID=56216 RepID=A0A1A6HY35_NEOLE|nr:hypothetical protein A6R68_22843 [Neotoma lepida]